MGEIGFILDGRGTVGGETVEIANPNEDATDELFGVDLRTTGGQWRR